VGTRGPDTAQAGGVDPGVDQPPHRGRRRGGTKDVFPIAAALSDSVDAVRPVGHRSGQIGEHRTRRIHPRVPIRVRQYGRDLRRKPGQISEAPCIPIPACDTTPWPSVDTFTRETATIFFTCEVPSRQHYGTLRSPIMTCRTGTFAYLHSDLPTLREKCRLVPG
jgi:hypothetical protein